MVGSVNVGSSLRLDIQGLRALAVALVVIFHLSPTLLSGGYIGVDVFFVISGYLITSHLMREVERTGGVKLSQFWARRVRRLLPAAMLVLGVSAIAVLLLFPRTGAEQNLNEIALAAVYLLNWGLAVNSVDYLAADNSPSIAQHYWSLSVEEQFYIVWPLLIILAVWLASKSKLFSRRNAIFGVLIVVLAASLAFSVYETTKSQPSAYFVTTTRAWEFAVGGLMSMIPVFAFRGRLAGPVKILASWLAAAAVLGAALFFDAETAFPGWIALIPVLATGFLLWVGDDESTWSPQFVARAGPIQYVGDASYSIYLWHWPLIMVFVVMEGRSPGWKWILLLAAVTIVLGGLTKKFVEDPVRRAPGVLKRTVPTYGAMLTGIALIAAITVVPVQIMKAENAAYAEAISVAVEDTDGCFGAYAVINDCAHPYAVTDTVNPPVSVEDKFDTHLGTSDACERISDPGRREYECILSDPEDPAKRVVLIGDSHGEAFASAMQRVGDAQGWRVDSRTKTACSTFTERRESAAATLTEANACADWAEQAYAEFAADSSIDLVVVAIRTTLHDRDLNYEGAVRQLRLLKESGRPVVIIQTVPGSEYWWMAERRGLPRFAPGCVGAYPLILDT